MQTTDPILLHIGYHKTGTTWMQRAFFVEDYGFFQVISHDEVYAHITDPHELTFDPAAAAEALAPHCAAVPPDLTPVISSEIMSGHPFYGGLLSAQYARRLCALFPQGRLLITIREQMRMLASVYMQYVSRGGSKPPEAFFSETNTPGFAHFSAEHFCYHRLVGLYRELFGADRVLVMTQEQMARDLASFGTRVTDFAGARPRAPLPQEARREGVSNPEFAYPVLRRINHFRADSPSDEPAIDLGGLGRFAFRAAGKISREEPVRGWLKAPRPVDAFVRDRFAGRFEASNRALKDMLGDAADLSGYPM